MTKETETGETQLQAKDGQGLPATTGVGERHRTLSLHLYQELTLPTP